MEQSRNLFSTMYVSQRFFRMVMKSLPMQDVKAMGRKLEGDVGSSFADDFGMSLMAANFQWLGTVD